MWSNDNSAIFLANDSVGLITSGLWRIDAKTGAGVTLIQGSTGGGLNFVGWPRQAPDGRLLYFFGQSAAFPDNGYWPVAMVISAADGVTGRAQLRTDSYIVGEALWSSDAAMAVVNDISGVVGGGAFPWRGPLRLLKTDNTPAITLADSGHNLRWGR